jgi:AcrR family transcriptional regulator
MATAATAGGSKTPAKDLTKGRTALPEARAHADGALSQPMSKAHEILLNMATELFGEVGYERATVREIAKRMGILSGSLYSHISSKEELLNEIIRRIGQEFIVRAEEAIEQLDDPEECLREIAVRHITVLYDYQLAVSVYFDEWNKLGIASQQPIIEWRRYYEELIANVFKRGIEIGVFETNDVKTAVLVIISTLNWTNKWYKPGSSLSPEKLANNFMDVILGGLRTDVAGRGSRDVSSTQQK